MSLPSEETDLYFSLTITEPLQPASLQTRLPPAVLVGTPVLSITSIETVVPAQTGMRCAVIPNAPLPPMMCPVMRCNTFGLLLGLWPLPIVVILTTGQRSEH